MDLNVLIEEFGDRDPQALINKKINHLIKLGYTTIALAIKLSKDDKNVPEPPSIEVKGERTKILTRLTLQLDDPGNFYKLSQSPNFKKFDILAIEPTNDKMMNQFCGGQLDCDILTLTMCSRLEIDLKRANLSLPASRGICFEINYSDALVSTNSRVNLFSAAQLLVEKSRSKNILISSGTKLINHLRAPYDVANLSLLFGLKENVAKEGVFKRGQLVIKHADTRRNSCSRAVKIEPIVKVDTTSKMEESA